MSASPLDVAELERVPAPDRTPFVRDYLRRGRPVVRTGVADDAVAIHFWWGGPVVTTFALASATFKRVRDIRRDEWG